MTIAIYSDFDGVFNIKKTKQTRTVAVETKDTEFLAPLSFVNWDPHVVVKLKSFLSNGDYDFIWHTTWNHGENSKGAANAIGLLGLDKQSIATLNTRAVDKKEWTQWKADFIVADQMKNPRPFIWIDDHAPEHWGDFVIEATTSEAYMIVPDSEIGLTLDQIDGLEEWAQKNFMALRDNEMAGQGAKM